MLTLKDITTIRERYKPQDWERLGAQLHNDAIVPVAACRTIEILCDELERRMSLEDELRGGEMSGIKTGGPAFPATKIVGGDNYRPPTEVYYTGMTLRDWFAGKVLPSVFADAMREAREGSGLYLDPTWREGLARDAYAMADAMLKAREVGHE